MPEDTWKGFSEVLYFLHSLGRKLLLVVYSLLQPTFCGNTVSKKQNFLPISAQVNQKRQTSGRSLKKIPQEVNFHSCSPGLARQVWHPHGSLSAEQAGKPGGRAAAQRGEAWLRLQDRATEEIRHSPEYPRCFLPVTWLWALIRSTKRLHSTGVE